MPFDRDYVNEVETALERQLPGRWRRLSDDELNQINTWYAGWNIDLPEGAVLVDCVDHLQIVVNSVFPRSQPRVRAPQIEDVKSWPHVEKGELLCLRKSRIGCNAGDRCKDHLCWAIELLNYDEPRRQNE